MRSIFSKGRPIFAIGLLLILASCASGQQEEKSESVSKRESHYEVLAENLSIPWSIVKNGEDFYMTERTGGIVHVKDGKRTDEKVNLSMPLASQPEAGLLGLALHPDFNGNKQAFAYYTYQDDSGTPYNRVVLLEKNGDLWEEKDVLLDKIPSGVQYHHGGRLEIGPDRKLYITTGDATKEEKAQDLSFLGGKILRLELDGSIPKDNPFDDSPVYSFGHRNPQGLAWDQDGAMYGTEHGPNGYDEVNLLQAGKNYGWPVIKGDEMADGMISPLVHSGEPSWAPSGADFWRGKLLFASIAGQSVKMFDPATKEVRSVIEGLGRIRDVLVEGDTLYFVSNNTDGRGIPKENDDKLYKVDLNALTLEE
ncbi:PQQ-dependent sugar dehydrogenase [Rossellomorea aquimaris]|uniref:PQQ-dependent sugar dehydrogenase n=1 Tax=Rossellomorea aquimaris TaxID=189382 RepID=UPI001CD54021|nr:PQQ-dependent sugar dehydrogenase [Rossellomorea aquimaris]MCA1055028.1 PQQ-dependent sugar dehydrogenase [Rossellomorea aquimaris]